MIDFPLNTVKPYYEIRKNVNIVHAKTTNCNNSIHTGNRHYKNNQNQFEKFLSEKVVSLCRLVL